MAWSSIFLYHISFNLSLKIREGGIKQISDKSVLRGTQAVMPLERLSGREAAYKFQAGCRHRTWLGESGLHIRTSCHLAVLHGCLTPPPNCAELASPSPALTTRKKQRGIQRSCSTKTPKLEPGGLDLGASTRHFEQKEGYHVSPHR